MRCLPTLTLVGVQFTFLIGGTVIIERLFCYEGLGNMAIDAVINRDLPLIQGIVILFARALHGGEPVRRSALCRAEPEAAPWLMTARARRSGGAPGCGCGCRAAGWRCWCWRRCFAPWIAPQDPLAQDLFLGRLPPFWMAGSRAGLSGWAPTAWAAMC